LLGRVYAVWYQTRADIFRIVYFLPYVFASVVNTQIWRQILHPRVGIGPIFTAEYGISFLEDFPQSSVPAQTALLGVAFVDGWHFWGFLVILFLSAMVAVDTGDYMKLLDWTEQLASSSFALFHCQVSGQRLYSAITL
jgi:ABC-type sugar transport system permease subunit